MGIVAPMIINNEALVEPLKTLRIFPPASGKVRGKNRAWIPQGEGLRLGNNAIFRRIKTIAMAARARYGSRHNDGATTLAYFVLLGMMHNFLRLAEAGVFGFIRNAHTIPQCIPRNTGCNERREKPALFI